MKPTLLVLLLTAAPLLHLQECFEYCCKRLCYRLDELDVKEKSSGMKALHPLCKGRSTSSDLMSMQSNTSSPAPNYDTDSTVPALYPKPSVRAVPCCAADIKQYSQIASEEMQRVPPLTANESCPDLDFTAAHTHSASTSNSEDLVKRAVKLPPLPPSFPSHSITMDKLYLVGFPSPSNVIVNAVDQQNRSVLTLDFPLYNLQRKRYMNFLKICSRFPIADVEMVLSLPGPSGSKSSLQEALNLCMEGLTIVPDRSKLLCFFHDMRIIWPFLKDVPLYFLPVSLKARNAPNSLVDWLDWIWHSNCKGMDECFKFCPLSLQSMIMKLVHRKIIFEAMEARCDLAGLSTSFADLVSYFSLFSDEELQHIKWDENAPKAVGQKAKASL